jgi:hypothetical protein
MVTVVQVRKEMEANTTEEKRGDGSSSLRECSGKPHVLDDQYEARPRHLAIGISSRFLNNPGRQHWEGVKRVFRYPKGTTNLGLKFVRAGGPQSEVQLEGYTDSDREDAWTAGKAQERTFSSREELQSVGQAEADFGSSVIS